MRVGKALGITVIAALAMLVSACEEEAAVPPPLGLTRDAIGHYCNMIVVDHPGPKAQVHEKGRAQPLWFSSVRDALAYRLLPGEAQSVTATYVHDMGRSENWERPPDDGIWIQAATAHFVIGSSRRGGMGAQEAVPFADADAAKRFMARFGGRIVALDEIPADYVIGDRNDHSPTKDKPSGHHHNH